MKKFICLLICLISIGIGVSVCAETQSGIIFRIEESEATVFSLAEQNDFVALGDGLYLATDMNAVYETFSPDEVLCTFPDCELELFDLDTSYVFNDTDYKEQWYMDAIDFAAVKDVGVTGKGVKIAVVDSGLKVDHPDLDQSKILEGYNCIANGTATDYNDNYGHGTAVTGIIAAQLDNAMGIAGVAPNASIIPIKITDGKTLTFSSILLGLNKAIACECDIINLSLGGKISDPDALAELKAVIDKAVDNGIIVVSAVGNYGTSDVYYPAGFDNVIGVGSLEKDMSIATFSQRNNSVFVTVPGRSLVSLAYTGGTKAESGTSVSTPIVTGIVALVKEAFPEYTYDDIADLFMKTAMDKGDTGYDIHYGYGVLNVKAVLESLYPEMTKLEIDDSNMENGVLSVFLNNNTEVCSGRFALAYDSDMIELLRVNKGAALQNASATVEIDEENERIYVALDANGEMLASDALLTIEYAFKPSAANAALLYVDACNMYDENEEAVWVAHSGVGAKALIGDIYADGKINIKDIIKLNQYLAAWDMEWTNYMQKTADVYQDAQVDINDAILLSMYIAEMIEL